MTGATGYIGGRLVSRLLALKVRVRVLARDPARILSRSWANKVEIVQGDLLKPETLPPALEGIHTAYYLVHSMYSGPQFDLHDRAAAANFCRHAGSLKHVIYLGGLLPRGGRKLKKKRSKHLLSRAEIGRILARDLAITEFRAGPIIGSGSASFEMLRYLTERVPIMFCPSWVRNKVQPIAVRDVLSYLLLALDRGPCGVVEIGSESLTYKQMMERYARQRGLRRLVVPVPAFLPTRIGAGLIGLLTPVPAHLAEPLVRGMALPLRATQWRARHFFPEVVPMPFERAAMLALKRTQESSVETRWNEARAEPPSYSYENAQGMVREIRTRHVEVAPEKVFTVFSSLGGNQGWLRWNWAWRARGYIDRLIGGTGFRQGRRDPRLLFPGDVVDFWRVEAVTQPNLLRLHAEIRLPGRAWLQWETTQEGEGTRLVQTAAFEPQGLGGALYWVVLYPLHRLIFGNLIRAIGAHALEEPRPRRAPAGKANEAVSSGPPGESHGLFGDIQNFVLRRPRIATRIAFASRQKREDYTERILQRIGVDVTSYSVLNLHRIAVEVPVLLVFQDLLAWDGNSSCWPNKLAKIERLDDDLDRIQVLPFGLTRFPFGSGSRFGWRVPPLFELKALRIQGRPRELDPDNARFLLFSCSGGYPIGIFVMYVRSSIAHQGETGRTQVFLGVGFDFYGHRRLSRILPLAWLWELIHNRVTANVLIRFKQLCEWKFERLQAGMDFNAPAQPPEPPPPEPGTARYSWSQPARTPASPAPRSPDSPDPR